MMSNKIKAVFLFTGAGGMDIGFERAGVTIVFANEIVKEAAEVLTFQYCLLPTVWGYL